MAVETNTALKEALCAQQLLLQKLYNELDVEREASSSAASEALAMILRLQGEKAAVKMEAEHYKRLAEEKMFHAEESMEIFEDLIHQKEMEIANLDYQVQAYRYKLSVLGFEDTGPHEIKFPENLLQMNETSTTEMSRESLSRRNSAPPNLLKRGSLKRGNLERNRSVSPYSDMISKSVEESGWDDGSPQNMDSEKQMTDGINSYWDQIRKLDKIVENIAGEQYISLRSRSSRSSSAFSQLNESDHGQSHKKPMNDEMLSDTCNLSVHDVFEVPETSEILVSHEKPEKTNNGKSILKCESKVEKLVTFSEDHVKSYEKILPLNFKDKQVFLAGDDMVVDCHRAVDLATNDVAEGGDSTQIVNTTTEITEGEREDVISEEQGGSTTEREEVMRLLYEINKKLDSIQSEIRNEKTKIKESSQNFDYPMRQLSEAMLHFWL